jgi:hypothetical protein
MSSGDVDPGSQSEDASFPIPRLKAIPNPRPPILPDYQPDTTEFNFDMFQLFYSLVIFHLPAYDLDHIEPMSSSPDAAPLSNASQTVAQALDSEKPSPMILEHIVRKFLVHCHSQFLDLTAEPVLSRIAQFHNELVFTSMVLHQHPTKQALVNYADMLLAETYDLFNATFEEKVNEEYWGAEKSVDDVIGELLTKEVERLRLLAAESSEVLSRCIVRRALDRAPAAAVPKITAWAKDNGIAVAVDAAGGKPAGEERAKR